MKSSLIFNQDEKVYPIHDSIGDFLKARTLSTNSETVLDDYFLTPIPQEYGFVGTHFRQEQSGVFKYLKELRPEYSNHVMRLLLEGHASAEKENNKFKPEHNLMLFDLVNATRALSGMFDKKYQSKLNYILQEELRLLGVEMSIAGSGWTHSTESERYYLKKIKIGMIEDAIRSMKSGSDSQYVPSIRSGEGGDVMEQAMRVDLSENPYSNWNNVEKYLELFEVENPSVIDLMMVPADVDLPFDPKIALTEGSIGEKILSVAHFLTNRSVEHYDKIRALMSKGLDNRWGNYALNHVKHCLAHPDYHFTGSGSESIIRSIKHDLNDEKVHTQPDIFPAQVRRNLRYLLGSYPDAHDDLVQMLNETKVLDARVLRHVLDEYREFTGKNLEDMFNTFGGHIWDSRIMESCHRPTKEDLEFSTSNVDSLNPDFGYVVQLAYFQQVVK